MEINEEIDIMFFGDDSLFEYADSLKCKKKLELNEDYRLFSRSDRQWLKKQEKETARSEALRLKEEAKKAWALTPPSLHHPGFFDLDLNRWNCCCLDDKDSTGCQMDVLRHHFGKVKLHMSKLWSRRGGYRSWSTWTCCNGRRNSSGCEDGARPPHPN
jgi:hypothetical protein